MAADGNTVYALLHTPAGGLVFWDGGRWRARHAGPEGVPRNLACFSNGRQAHLIVFDPGSGAVLGNLATGTDGELSVVPAESAPLWAVAEESGRLSLDGPAGRLAWATDGTVGVASDGAAENCRFVAISSLTDSYLRTVGAGECIQGNGAPVARVAADGVPALLLGGEAVTLGGLPGPFVPAEMGAGSMPRQLHVVGPQGPLHRVGLFRPVVCFAVFGGDGYYEALGLALQALHAFGGYEGCVCIGADRPRAAVDPYLPAIYRANWRHVGILAEAGLFARYGIGGWGLEAFQPVLYLDADIVANAPLRPLLTQLAMSPRVHVATEREWEVEFAGRRTAELASSKEASWFGGCLFAADPRYRKRLPAFGVVRRHRRGSRLPTQRAVRAGAGLAAGGAGGACVGLCRPGAGKLRFARLQRRLRAVERLRRFRSLGGASRGAAARSDALPLWHRWWRTEARLHGTIGAAIGPA